MSSAPVLIDCHDRHLKGCLSCNLWGRVGGRAWSHLPHHDLRVLRGMLSRQHANTPRRLRNTVMLSDAIDLRIYLTDGQFQQRVLRSEAWANYLTLPPILPFDDTAALAEINQRNATRSANHLPLLNAERELVRLRKTYESRTFADRFDALATECIGEIYGPITPKDFNSMSAARGFFASKQNVIRRLTREQSGCNGH
jgi:hypothetical protein